MITTDTEIIKRIPGYNFVTPTLVETGLINGVVPYEISKGSNPLDRKVILYGLTLEEHPELSNCYDSYDECYINLRRIDDELDL